MREGGVREGGREGGRGGGRRKERGVGGREGETEVGRVHVEERGEN